jgi:RNA polymerase sigma factor (sigma-70 family)
MARAGNAGAFETIVDRYQGRLLGFCRQMLGSTEDAEDVLQEVFVNAYRAMLADEREINLRPWLYRIARNRCLNHLRKPTADAQESMDMVPAVEASSTAEKVHNREEFRQLLTDVGKLPETQRSALLLREMDAMSYEEIAQAMETSVPSVKSLLVRARIALAEASQARQLTCGEVRLELAEATEGLRKVSGPVRRHVRDCEGCADFRTQVRSNEKALAALAAPVGALAALKGFVASKLGFGGAGAGAGSSAAGAGASAGSLAGAGAVGSVGSAALGGGGGAVGGIGGALGAKAVAGVVTAAVLTAGAGEAVNVMSPAAHHGATISHVRHLRPRVSIANAQVTPPVEPTAQAASAPVSPDSAPAADQAPPSTTPVADPTGDPAGSSSTGGDTAALTLADHAPADVASDAGTHSGGAIAVVTVGSADSSSAAPSDSSSTPPPDSSATPPPDSSGASSSSTDSSASTSATDPADPSAPAEPAS